MKRRSFFGALFALPLLVRSAPAAPVATGWIKVPKSLAPTKLIRTGVGCYTMTFTQDPERTVRWPMQVTWLPATTQEAT